MNYIILDLEWNQPFGIKSMIAKPVFLQGEIIQIGAVKMDGNYNILDIFKIIVTPKYYTKMHKKVSKLTQITTEGLRYGFPLPIALKYFRKWCGDEFVFFTWGADDMQMLRKNMMLHEMEMQWLPKTYNLQIIFDDQITKENRQISLTDAMEKIGEVALDAHDALNDARNTACVCQHLDILKGFSEYDVLQKRMNRYADNVVERNPILKTYASKEAALNDVELIQFFCSSLGQKVFCRDFVKQNSYKYLCIGQCEDGNEFFVRFKFKKLSGGDYGISRIVYEMNEENSKYYMDKKLHQEESRERNTQRHEEVI